MEDSLSEMLSTCDSELADIEKYFSSLSVFDKKRSYLTQYALMRVCGTCEFVYRSIVADFLTQNADKRVLKYLDNNIREGSMGLNYDNMMSLLGMFDKSWRDEFKKLVKNHKDKDNIPDGEKIRSSANSLYVNRNLFAHGKTPNITFESIKIYFEDVKVLLTLYDSVVC